MRVYAKDAAFDFPRKAQSALEIIGPEGAAQAIRGSVDVADHFVLVLEGDDADHGSEDLFAPATILFIWLNQDGRLKIKTLLVESIAAAAKRSARFFRVTEESFNRVALGGGSEWTKLGLVFGRITGQQPLRRGNEEIDKFFKDWLLHEHPAASATILAGVGKDAHRRGFGRALPISIGKDDIRRFAAEFERDALQVARRQFHDSLADTGRTSEGNFSN